MPYIIEKVRGKKCWSVKNRNTKKIFSKCSSKENAKKQIRLLRAIENNKSFIPVNKSIHIVDKLLDGINVEPNRGVESNINNYKLRKNRSIRITRYKK